MDKILVAFASKYGSTQEVAEVVAETLRRRGLTVEVRLMRQVSSLEEYGGVVLGAPIYFGALYKEAVNFLTQHQQALTAHPVAFFALGPTRPDPEEIKASRGMLDQQLAKFPWLTPVAIELFGGKYDPAKLRISDKLIAALPASPLHGAPASDARDWNAIRAWANDLASKLQPVAA